MHYGNTFTAGMLAAGGTVAATTSWSIAGFIAVGLLLAAAGLATARRLARRNRQ